MVSQTMLSRNVTYVTYSCLHMPCVAICTCSDKALRSLVRQYLAVSNKATDVSNRKSMVHPPVRRYDPEALNNR